MKRRSEVLELYDGVRAQRPLAELVSFRLLFHGRLLRLRRDAECSSAALQKLAALATAVDRLLEQHFDTKQFLRMVSRWNMLFAPNKNFRVDVPLASNGFLKGIEICDLLYRNTTASAKGPRSTTWPSCPVASTGPSSTTAGGSAWRSRRACSRWSRRATRTHCPT